MKVLRVGWMYLAVGVVVAGCMAATPQRASDPAGADSPLPRPALGLPAHGAQPGPPGAADAPASGVEIPADLLAAVRADAAQRTGRTPEAVLLVHAEHVTWRDASLGCPKPGAHYPQVLTPGYQIVFAVEGSTFDYRAPEGGQFRLCEGLAQMRPGDPLHPTE